MRKLMMTMVAVVLAHIGASAQGKPCSAWK